MSDKGLRLFVAVDIPTAARRVISSAVEGMRGELAGARWVKPENLHLTLKFIGDYMEKDLERLVEEIKASGERCEAFRASLGGCGAFPSQGRARVIWLGMSEGIEGAGAVARKLDARLERVGVKREERPFRGHITLARLRQPGDCKPFLDGLGSRIRGLRDIDFEVDEIVLYRSILGQQGPRYMVLEKVALGGNASEKG
jgi:RNA 2',3'-cyclic 3'-phosphodiesterase